MHNYSAAKTKSIRNIQLGRQMMDIDWEKPIAGWICLNLDGARKDRGGMAGCGGLLRDSDGRWLGVSARTWAPVVLIWQRFGEFLKA